MRSHQSLRMPGAHGGSIVGVSPASLYTFRPTFAHAAGESPGPAWLGVARPTASAQVRRASAKGSTEFTRFAPAGCPAGSLLNEGNRRSIRLSYEGNDELYPLRVIESGSLAIVGTRRDHVNERAPCAPQQPDNRSARRGIHRWRVHWGVAVDFAGSRKINIYI
jgi:hypothetical protein